MNYINDKMDFRVRINMQGLPGVVLYPVSKLFEYYTDGPLPDPVWRPLMSKGAETPAPSTKPTDPAKRKLQPITR